MASSSSSSSRNNNRWNYDVFLSFRGSDTRNTFTGYLYQALHDKGVNVFIDNELQRGEVITSQLLQVIEESEISIVVLSEKYASSSFCLDELVKILECRESRRQIVIPVFYHVDPTDVEEQRGTFGQEFVNLSAQFKKPNIDEDSDYLKLVPAKEKQNERATTDMEQNWRSALTNVAKLSGFHLKKGDHEATTVRSIVKLVLKRLDVTPLYVAKHPVGLASRVADILKDLSMKTGGVCMLGLHGMGGVGKTTTAKALYNECARQLEFDGTCFLLNVAENSKKVGLAKLQETLLFEILGDRKNLGDNFEKGIELIKRRLGGKKVLIVIDDVDSIDQLEKLAGGKEWFGAGTIIVISSRDLHLLKVHGVTKIHEIKKMEDEEAMELFNKHAFKEARFSEVYMELSSCIVRYAQGLPLALEVLGSFLYGRNVEEWKDVLMQLERCPNKKITDVLKLSYDGLDSEEKAIFLDIVVFFKGENEDEVIRFLKACGFGAYIGIRRLIEKSLLHVERGTLEMHDLLKEMGIQIACQDSSRLCIRKQEDIHRLIMENKKLCDVEGIRLDLHGEEGVALNWLQNLRKLRILIICNGCFIKVPNKLPNSIRWLEWHNYSVASVPPEFLPADLAVLKMPCSSLMNPEKSLLSSIGLLAQKFMGITHMNFSFCKYLWKTIDFSAAPNLQVLNLSRCEKLQQVDESIGCLKKLATLNLAGCCSLVSLPNLVENQRLKFIKLDYCSQLENLPILPTTVTSLFLENSGVKEIPSFIGNLTNLSAIYASNCKNLISVSDGIYKLPRLSQVSFPNCPNLPKLPEAESSMLPPTLTPTGGYLLELFGNKFDYLPTNTFKFIHVTSLNLNNCEWLVEIPELPDALWYLQARNCKSLVRFSQFQFEYLTGDFSNCHKLAENEIQSWRVMLQNLSLIKMKKEDPWRLYYILLPGNKIPEWFSYGFEYKGNDPSFKLPHPISTHNLIGIACCAIFQYPESHYRTVKLQFSISDFTFARNFDLYSPLESEHMLLCFGTRLSLRSFLDAKEISCKCSSSNHQAVFKRVGVHFIYRS